MSSRAQAMSEAPRLLPVALGRDETSKERRRTISSQSRRVLRRVFGGVPRSASSASLAILSLSSLSACSLVACCCSLVIRTGIPSGRLERASLGGAPESSNPSRKRELGPGVVAVERKLKVAVVEVAVCPSPKELVGLSVGRDWVRVAVDESVVGELQWRDELDVVGDT